MRKFKCKCGTITEELYPDIITVCNNCGLHLNNVKPYIEKIKPITCRGCIYKISATDLNKIYKEKGLKRYLGGEFEHGIYCLKQFKNNEPQRLFKGLKHLACNELKLKT